MTPSILASPVPLWYINPMQKFVTETITNTEFTHALLQWYDQNARSLPWRQTRDPYAIWVSETMLQQTRVDTVIPYYLRFMKQFPTIAALAEADETEVVKAWEGLGYYRRARLLHQGVKKVVAEYRSVIPNDPAAILALPGVGPYMAGAIASIAFNLPTPAIDGNVSRVATRQLAWVESPETKQSHQIILAWVKARIPTERAGDFTQSLMELGALVCSPRNPKCNACPVSPFCLGKGTPECFPVKKAKRPVPAERHIALVINWNQRRLLIQRPNSGLMSGFWEYPHFQVQPGENTQIAANQWTVSQLGSEVNYSFQRHMKHVYSHLQWNLEIFEGEWTNKTLPKTPVAGNWFTPEEECSLARVAFTRRLRPPVSLN
ncbi:MAG TPA: A/G-specific adenine glycosylase [Bacillota bacterium]|nr:A/G-specific adenine glycosylase [Bacillota bacterium]